MATKTKAATAAISEYKPRPPLEDRKSGPFDEYEVQDALRTIAKANKMKKNPALMRAVKAEAKRQLAAAEATVKTV